MRIGYRVAPNLWVSGSPRLPKRRRRPPRRHYVRPFLAVVFRLSLYLFLSFVAVLVFVPLLVAFMFITLWRHHA